MWWGSNEQRRAQKEMIKNIIKRTKLTEKAAAQATIINTHAMPSCTTPPSLCHSTPSDIYSDGMMRTRGGSVESQNSFDFATPHIYSHDMFNANPGMMMPPQHAMPFPYPYMTPITPFMPYEMDIKTERHTFVNDIQTRRDSTISTFSTYPSALAANQAMPMNNPWVLQEHHHETVEFTEEPLDMYSFGMQQQTPLSPPQPQQAPYLPSVQVDECDQYLLDHFVANVAPLIFPIIEANRPGSSLHEVIFPALETNKTYLHCCLSISALHMKAIHMANEQTDSDIVRHNFATITELCEALNRDEDHMAILEATLSMIFFQCGVGRPEDCLPELPWHAHFQAATSLVNKLELPAQLVASSANPLTPPPFNMSIAAWIDILGATMLGQTPIFADTYRETHIAGGSAGLSDLMGCEDRIMFLISEIACLEALKKEGINTVDLCQHIRMLGEQITMTETSPLGSTASSPLSNASGNMMTDMCQKNITSIFRIAARIYLCSLLPDFDYAGPQFTSLVSSLTSLLHMLPSTDDRAVAWPLLIAGSSSMPGSEFRRVFADRMAISGGQGSLGRCAEILNEHWKLNDGLPAPSRTHWRDAMKGRGWDWLVI